MMTTTRLTDAIWMIDTGSRYDCHLYLVDGGSSAALIDCGTGLAADALLDAIEATGCSDRLEQVFVTHYHADHAGGAAQLRAALDVRICGSAETAAALSAGDEDATQVAAAREAGVYPSDYRYSPSSVDEVLADGAVHRVGQVSVTSYASPGHCDGHLCFLIDTGSKTALCSGDAIFHGGRISIQAIPDCSPYLYARTAERLATLPVDLLLPGHQEIVMDNGAEHLARAAESFRRLVPPPNVLNATDSG